MTDTPLVDAHVHVFTQDMPLIDHPRHAPTYDFTVEQLVSALDRHGVPLALIAAASPWGDYNDYTIAATRAHKRLRGTVILKPSVERYILERMQEDGIVGVRLPFIGLAEMPDLATAEYRRFLRRVADLDWHIHLHVEGAQLAPLIPPLEQSGVKLVIDHMGRPDPRTGVGSDGFQAMVRSVAQGRTWVKLSAAYRLGAGADDYCKALVQQCDPDRLMWASDCPFVGAETKVTYAATIALLNDCVADPAARRKIFGETALKLYFS